MVRKDDSREDGREEEGGTHDGEGRRVPSHFVEGAADRRAHYEAQAEKGFQGGLNGPRK